MQHLRPRRTRRKGGRCGVTASQGGEKTRESKATRQASDNEMDCGLREQLWVAPESRIQVRLIDFVFSVFLLSHNVDTSATGHFLYPGLRRGIPLLSRVLLIIPQTFSLDFLLCVRTQSLTLIVAPLRFHSDREQDSLRFLAYMLVCPPISYPYPQSPTRLRFQGDGERVIHAEHHTMFFTFNKRVRL